MENPSICERKPYHKLDYAVDCSLLSKKDKNWASKRLYYNWNN
ncbi:1473_t:CDS:2 [Gigaspora rosea]|nr:1473_t:CDS:2 [Gigaspora rosea]